VGAETLDERRRAALSDLGEELRTVMS
jgi:hypothetical protein